MKQAICILSALVAVNSPLFAILQISIIESQSGGHGMDQRWLDLVDDMGDDGTILPQSTLDNSDFFATTDLLIVSSGTIALPENRWETVKQFLENGGDVYLTTEYLTS